MYDVPLAADFFSKADVNVGNVNISVGELKGAVTGVSFRGNTLTLQTNWTDRCIDGAGFLDKDDMTLSVKGRQFDLTLFKGQVPQNAGRPGAGFLVRSRRDENYVIYLFSKELGPFTEQLELLMPLSIVKK